MQAYKTLEARFARISSIEDAIGILQWDAETRCPTELLTVAPISSQRSRVSPMSFSSHAT